jgi:hypothetical protein
LAAQSDSASSSPVKTRAPLLSQSSVICAWADLLFSAFTAVKRESKDESEKYLLGFANLHDVFVFFLQDAGQIADEETRRFYVTFLLCIGVLSQLFVFRNQLKKIIL